MRFTKSDGFLKTAQHLQRVAQVSAGLCFTQNVALNSSRIQIKELRLFIRKLVASRSNASFLYSDVGQCCV